LAQAGFAGLNFHGGFEVCDAPLFNGKFQRYTPLRAARHAGAAAGVHADAPELRGLSLDTLRRSAGSPADAVPRPHSDGAYAARLCNAKFQRYTPICAANDADAAAKVYTAMPEYYGLYLATLMGSGRFLPVTLSSDHNVTAYAVRGYDGRVRIAVIEKDATNG